MLEVIFGIIANSLKIVVGFIASIAACWLLVIEVIEEINKSS